MYHRQQVSLPSSSIIIQLVPIAAGLQGRHMSTNTGKRKRS
jgi:hypothetical protein